MHALLAAALLLLPRPAPAAYYRGAMGILLVYDVTDEASFNNIRNWMRNIEQHASDNVNKASAACRRSAAGQWARSIIQAAPCSGAQPCPNRWPQSILPSYPLCPVCFKS
jgi:hypothetical protein